MDYYETASQLYDGGWTSEDCDEIVAEYGLSARDASRICAIIATFEEASE